MVPAIVADLCREHSADVVNAELVKTMAVHAMKELFGQVIHCLSRATDYISGIRGTCHKYSLKRTLTGIVHNGVISWSSGPYFIHSHSTYEKHMPTVQILYWNC